MERKQKNEITGLAQNKLCKGGLLDTMTLDDCRKCARSVATELQLGNDSSNHFSGRIRMIPALIIKPIFRNQPWDQGGVEGCHYNMTPEL
jgi:hypothetical protein